MLKRIKAHEVGLCGRALEVRCRPDPARADLVVVDLAACVTEGEAGHVRRSEMVLLVTDARMTRESLRARVEAEAGLRAIERVAWIEEG